MTWGFGAKLKRPRKPPSYATSCENCGTGITPKRGRHLCDTCPPLRYTAADELLSENDIQQRQCLMLTHEFPQVWYCMIPNGAYLSTVICKLLGKAKGAILMGRITNFLRSMGMRVGAPDMFIQCPGGLVVWNEVKTVKGQMGNDQVAVHAELRRRGATVLVTRTVDDLRVKLRLALQVGPPRSNA